jgi:hypothetical protein
MAQQLKTKRGKVKGILQIPCKAAKITMCPRTGDDGYENRSKKYLIKT